MVSEQRDSEPQFLYFFRQLTEAYTLSKPLVNNDFESADPRFEDGMPLPLFLRQYFPKYLLGIPIEEIDPFYCNKDTFVIVGTNWVIRRYSTSKSLWFLSSLNPFRSFLIRILNHAVYRVFMTLLLFVYVDIQLLGHYFLEPVLTAIFVLEVIVKVLACGFVLHPFSYIRNPWNVLDFLLTLAALGSYCLSWLASISCLRILRLIHCFTYSRQLFSWIIRKFHLMADLLLYSIFVLCLLSIHGLLNYQGVIHNACFSNLPAINAPSYFYVINRSSSGGNPIAEERFRVVVPINCGNSSLARQCPENFVCLNTGYFSRHAKIKFDNFFWSFFQILRLFTHVNWKDAFTLINHALGGLEVPTIMIIVVVGFLLSNLIAAYMAAIITQLIDVLNGKKPKKLTTKIKNVKISMREQHEEVYYSSDKNLASTTEKEKTSVDEKDVISTTKQQITNTDLNSEANKISEELILKDTSLNKMPCERNDETLKEEKRDSEKSDRTTNPLVRIFLNILDTCCVFNCSSCCSSMQRGLSRFVLHPYFDAVIYISIAINVFILTLNHLEVTAAFHLLLLKLNIIFTAIYILEAVLKILALSPKYYFQDCMNRHDFIIVLLCCITLAIRNISGISLLRVFRILRVTRWNSNIKYIFKMNFAGCIIVIVVTLVFGLCGTTVLPSSYMHIPSDVMSNIRRVIAIISGYLSTRNIYFLFSNSWLGVPFFLTVIAVGNFMIFMLFIIWIMAFTRSQNLCNAKIEESVFMKLQLFWKAVLSSKYCKTYLSSCQECNTSQQELCDILIEDENGQITEHIVEDVKLSPCCWDACYKWMPWQESSTRKPNSTVTRSCQSLFWKKWLHYREKFLTLTNHQYYNIGMSLFIILSSIPLTWENKHLKSGTAYSAISIVTNILVVIIFSGDILLQIIGNGCKKYFVNGWSIFDFLISLAHVIDVIFVTNGPCSALRLMRLIPKLQCLRVVIAALLYKTPFVLDALLVCSIFWLLFTIIGIQLFAGMFYSCVDKHDQALRGVRDKDLCLQQNNTWRNNDVNFDNFGNSFIALLQVATMNGEKSLYFTGALMQGTLPSLLLFISFPIFGHLGCLALILSAFIMKANEQKKEISGYVEILMTDKQRKAYCAKKATFFMIPKLIWKKPTFQPFVRIYRLVISSTFRILIIITLVLNLLVLCATVEGANTKMATALTVVNFVFYLVFVVEVLLRLIGLGSQFFKVSWNIFDGVLVILTAFGMVLSKLGVTTYVFTDLLSLLRVFRLTRWLKSIRRIQSRINDWIPVFANVGFLMLVLSCIMSIFFMKTYGHEPFLINYDDHLNFETFFSSLGIMVQISLGSYWDVACEGLQGHSFARFLIIAYMLLSLFIIIQSGSLLFLEKYHYILQKMRFGVVDQNLEDFTYAWRILDPDATGFIPCSELSEFVNTLPAPLQIPTPNEDAIAALDIPIYKNDKVAFKDVLMGVIIRLNIEESNLSSSTKQETDCDVISSTRLRQQEGQNSQNVLAFHP